jgi:transcriptional regulator with XRE-family HTH domain
MARAITGREGQDGRVRQRIGPTLRHLRTQRGLSLLQLAEAADVSPSHLSRMERGRTVPSYDLLCRLAEALGVEIGELRREELATKSVDATLDGLLRVSGVSEASLAELHTLSPATRAEVAEAISRYACRHRAATASAPFVATDTTGDRMSGSRSH